MVVEIVVALLEPELIGPMLHLVGYSFFPTVKFITSLGLVWTTLLFFSKLRTWQLGEQNPFVLNQCGCVKDFQMIVKNSWDQDHLNLDETITSFTNSISYWNSNTFKNIFKRKKRLLARILSVHKLLCSNNCDQLRILEKQLQDELLALFKSEEEFWFLKSKINWLSLGDKNTIFSRVSWSKEEKIN